MRTIVVFYDDGEIHTLDLNGQFRALAYDPETQHIMLVGNNGKVVRIANQEIIEVDASTLVHLRGVSANPMDGSLLIVGNAGTVLTFKERMAKVESNLFENLRTVAWNALGNVALIVGNAGCLLKYSALSLTSLCDGSSNLRRVTWHPKKNHALIASNCFAQDFLPSPNLFHYDDETGVFTAVNEGRVDLIGADWKPDGDSALLVGYDVLWHNGFIGQFDGQKLTSLEFKNKQVYPVSAAWNHSADLAAICTSVAQPGMGKGSVRLWDGRKLVTVFESDEYFFNAVAWNRHGILIAIGSPASRAFNC